mgnify:CR=1 FL=1
MSKPQIALGTAQFGLNYGITNSQGKVSREEVRSLLELAQEAKIPFLDTAQAYGNAEEVLGKTLLQPTRFRIISKLPAQRDGNFDAIREQHWQQGLETSLDKLQIPCLDALLLHSARDLVRTDGQRLLDWLIKVQAQGLIQRFGVSIYQQEELDALPLDQLQLVQLPCSLYDQRLIEDGTAASLQQRGIAVHGRSLYLQGLLVTPTAQWPEGMSTAFRQHHQNLEALAKEKQCSLVELALGWVRTQICLEAAVIGVTRPSELQALIQAWDGPQQWKPNEASQWSWKETGELDPRQWKP